MSNRVYKKYQSMDNWFVSITEEDGTKEVLGPYVSSGIAQTAMKNRKIKNHDVLPAEVPLRNRSGNFVSLIEKADVDEAIETMKTPKDIQKIMKKLLKHPHSVRALGTILFNPYHPKYAQVLEVATRIATEVPKAKPEDEQNKFQPLLLNIPRPIEIVNKVKNAEEIVYAEEVAVSGSIQ